MSDPAHDPSDEPLDELDAEVVEDLDVDEVRGGELFTDGCDPH